MTIMYSIFYQDSGGKDVWHSMRPTRVQAERYLKTILELTDQIIINKFEDDSGSLSDDKRMVYITDRGHRWFIDPHKIPMMV